MSRIDAAMKRVGGQAGAPRLMEDASFEPFAAELSLGSSTGEAAASRDVPLSIPLPSNSGQVEARASEPIVVSHDQAPHRQNASADELIGMPSPALLAQYRRIAAMLQEAQATRGLKTFTVTSAAPEDDRARAAVHLALTLVDTYARRVLVIDADRDTRAVHQLLNLPNDAGFGEAMLARRSSVAPTRVTPLLWVLPAGRAGREPGQALAPERLEALLADTSSQFDWIILNAPPASEVHETRLLVRLARAAVLVISARSTPFPVVHRTMSDLGKEYILATVLNE